MADTGTTKSLSHEANHFCEEKNPGNGGHITLAILAIKGKPKL